MWIYTSTGTGFWGPPNRFLKPKELTLLVLKKT
jgi:predicted MPP superfamily phosphohydrolase